MNNLGHYRNRQFTSLTLSLPINRISPIKIYLKKIYQQFVITGPLVTLLCGLVMILIHLSNVSISVATSTSVFLFVIVYSALIGGIIPGILSVIIASIFSTFLLIFPRSILLFNGKDLVSLLPFLFTSIPLALVVGLLNNQVEVTAHERLLRERSEIAERKLTHILDSITDAFIALNHEEHFTYFNKASEKLFQKKAATLIGKCIWKTFPEFGNTLFQERLKLSIQINKPVSFEEYYPLLNQWWDIHIFPTTEGSAVYIRNITERKELEMKKEESISVVSHELKSPITSIKGYLQLLEKRLTINNQKDTARYLGRMGEEIDRVNSLISELLDISRIESGRLHFKEEAIDLNVLIKSTIEDCESLGVAQNIRLMGLSKNNIIADKERLRQVLINLITNAAKYSPNSERIIISLKEKEGQVIIQVRDFGIGISPENLNKIFDRFYRVESSQTSNVQGLGLGLYISSEIIKRFGGKMWVESKLGKGSVFYFALPIVSPTPGKTRNYPPS